MEEHGVDIAAGAAVGAALYQRALGADVHIVGGWRYDGPAGTRFYGSPRVRSLADMKGATVGIRERGSMDEGFLMEAFLEAGLDPERDVRWRFDPVFYEDTPKQFDAVEAGKVDLIPVRPGRWAEAEARGFKLILDTSERYPKGRPGKVIVATGRALRERGAELSAFLRGNLRAFWFVRTAANFPYLTDLDRRLRVESHNDFEHCKQLVTRVEVIESWPIPLDGAVSHDQLAAIIATMTAAGKLPAGLAVDNVLQDSLVSEAFRDLSARPELRAAREAAERSREKYGY